jgi:hypothetical protein
MRDRKGSIPELLLIYAGVLGVLALVVGYGFTKVTVASEEAARRSEQEKTVLAERIESAREIRRALARPVPPPDPLPPITAKPANSPVAAELRNSGKPKLAASGNSKPSKLKISTAAWNAMAMGTGADVSPQSGSTFERGAINGW